MPKSFSFEKFKVLSGSMLKLIAIITMLIDHTALLLGEELAVFTEPIFEFGETTVTLYFIMRKIGRLAFPIFCFLVTEGFIHTRNRKRYMLNMLLFAVISEIPYNFMKCGHPFFIAEQNVFFTLLLGVTLLYIYETVNQEALKAGLMFCVAAVAFFLEADYGLRGVLLILLLYALKDRPAVKTLLSYPMLSGGFAAFCAFVPINMYNGKRGFIKSGLLKYGFYVFYPLHITVLVIIKIILRQ